MNKLNRFIDSLKETALYLVVIIGLLFMVYLVFMILVRITGQPEWIYNQ